MLLFALVLIVSVVVLDLRARYIARDEIMTEVVCQGEINSEGTAALSHLLEGMAENPNRPVTQKQLDALERLQRNAERAEAAEKRCPR